MKILYIILKTYERISSFCAMLPFSIFWMMKAWSSSEICSRVIRGIPIFWFMSLPIWSQGWWAIWSNVARFSGFRSSIRDMRLKVNRNMGASSVWITRQIVLISLVKSWVCFSLRIHVQGYQLWLVNGNIAGSCIVRPWQHRTP